MDRILDFISDYALSLKYQNLPHNVLHQVRRRVIDTLGCAMGGYEMGPPSMARAHALEVESTPGSTILGTRQRSAPELAAFANGVMGRYLDFNDTSASSKGGHTSDNIMPLLAVAEYAGTDMQTTMTCIVIAYEIQDRFGAACLELRNNGWDHAVYVALSSAAAAGRALGLDKNQLANALALAAVANGAMSQTRVGQLSMWKGCTSPNAARNGVFAALMARRGMTGPDEAFEGSRGFKKQYGTALNLPAFGGDGVPYTIESDKFKLYPCDYEAQCSVTPARALHQILKGRLDEIEKIEVETYAQALEIAADGPAKWNPTSRETADHSIPYAVAVALTRGTFWLEDLTEDRIRDPHIHALMQKIEVRAVDEYTKAWPEAFPFRITATTRDGQKHVQEIRYAKGHVKNPMSDEEIAEKFRRLAQPLMSAAQIEKALSKLWHLEQMKGAREVLELFVLDAGGAQVLR